MKSVSSLLFQVWRLIARLACYESQRIAAAGRLLLAFLSSLAEDERARILARANGGWAAAKNRDVKFGPKPKLAAHQAREAARMVREEGKSLREVAHHYHVGHSTIVRVLGRAEA